MIRRRPIPRSRELKHGRRSTYINHRCRCPECREANAKHQRLRYWKKIGHPPRGKRWKWECPGCGDFGFTRERPTFSRCWNCDSNSSAGVNVPPLRIEALPK